MAGVTARRLVALPHVPATTFGCPESSKIDVASGLVSSLWFLRPWAVVGVLAEDLLVQRVLT